jgi:hypothetical protein
MAGLRPNSRPASSALRLTLLALVLAAGPVRGEEFWPGEPFLPDVPLPVAPESADGELPVWFGGAEGLLLARSGTRHTPFASRGATPTAIVLSTDQIQEFEYDGGVRAMTGVSLGPDLQLVGSYTGIHTWDQEAAVRNVDPNNLGGLGNLQSPFTGFGRPPEDGLDFNTLASIRNATDVDNGEINLYCKLPLPTGPVEYAAIFGARYVRLTEDFTYETESFVPAPGGARVEQQVATDNDLWGGQLGGLGTYTVLPDWWIDCEIRAALCQNFAEQVTSFAQVDEFGNTTFVSQSKREGVTSFVGELSVTSNVRIGRYLVLRGGYQVVWLESVAVAAENFSNDVARLTLGPSQINSDGTLVFHGPHLGALLTW